MNQSRTLNLSISNDILKSYPEIKISGMVAEITSSVKNNFNYQIYLKDHYENIKDLSWGVNGFSAADEIAKWRSVYSTMSIKPSKVKCSFECIFRRYAKDQPIFGINPFVDIYNFISLKHRLCMGAYDLEKLGCNINLRYGLSNEEMEPINSDTPLIFNEKDIVYVSNDSVICAYWNHRDSDKTKIDDRTQRVIFFIDEVKKVNMRAESALKELGQILKHQLNVNITDFFYLHQSKPSHSLILK
jgi:DNA/RNA-binding domain of Phe-tRNA-synthetase-like protein